MSVSDRRPGLFIDLLLCGELRKQQHVRTQWVPRYFVLTTHFLYYFNRPSSPTGQSTGDRSFASMFGTCKGIFHLRGIAGIGQLGQVDFEFVYEGKAKCLRASSSENRDLWVRALSDAVNLLAASPIVDESARGGDVSMHRSLIDDSVCSWFDQDSLNSSPFVSNKQFVNSNGNKQNDGSRGSDEGSEKKEMLTQQRSIESKGKRMIERKRRLSISGDYRTSRQYWPVIECIRCFSAPATVSLELMNCPYGTPLRICYSATEAVLANFSVLVLLDNGKFEVCVEKRSLEAAFQQAKHEWTLDQKKKTKSKKDSSRDTNQNGLFHSAVNAMIRETGSSSTGTGGNGGGMSAERVFSYPLLANSHVLTQITVRTSRRVSPSSIASPSALASSSSSSSSSASAHRKMWLAQMAGPLYLLLLILFVLVKSVFIPVACNSPSLFSFSSSFPLLYERVSFFPSALFILFDWNWDWGHVLLASAAIPLLLHSQAAYASAGSSNKNSNGSGGGDVASEELLFDVFLTFQSWGYGDGGGSGSGGSKSTLLISTTSTVRESRQCDDASSDEEQSSSLSFVHPEFYTPPSTNALGQPWLNIDDAYTALIAKHAETIREFRAACAPDIAAFTRLRDEEWRQWRAEFPVDRFYTADEVKLRGSEKNDAGDGADVRDEMDSILPFVRESVLAKEVSESGRGCLRFLIARQFKVPAALEMWRNSCVWREKYGVDDMLYSPYPEGKGILQQGNNEGDHGFVKNGDVFHIEMLQTQENYNILQKQYGVIQVCRQKIHWLEFKKRILLRGTLVDKGCNLLSLKGLSRKHLCKNTFQFLSRTSKESQDNYPEWLGKLIVVHVPMLFYVAWAVIKPWLSEGTKAKICFHSGAAEQFLDDEIGMEIVPTFLNGQCECVGGCMGGHAASLLYLEVCAHGWSWKERPLQYRSAK